MQSQPQSLYLLMFYFYWTTLQSTNVWSLEKQSGVPIWKLSSAAAVNRFSSKMYFSYLKKVHLKNQYQFKYLEYFHRFTLLSDSLF